ncbi:tyrosine--tRNA ligase [Patescibacteria group bacterium]|nr:MAG: tyrosine--tRNA ligase [Patescibacteria group bacterium]
MVKGEKTVGPLLSSRFIQDVVVRASLENKLASGRKLRVKIGMDPTAPDLHLGHAVALRLLRRFQNAGHTIVFIIGDFTAKIGDPSGKSKTRPMLDAPAIEANAKTYFEQVGLILDVKKAEIRRNSEWLGKLGFDDVIKLASKFTVARILERDDFAERFKSGSEISGHELLYPMMQAQDSVAVAADVEVGGTDQLFNMLAGRELQKKLGLPEQEVLTVPLLLGLDGTLKMSKSLGNYVGLRDKPEEMYGKLMSLPDRLLRHYFELATDLSDSEIEAIQKTLVGEKANPRDLKMRLARLVVASYHGEGAAESAEESFVKVFQKKEIPDEVKTVAVDKNKLTAAELLLLTGLAASKSEARRVIEQRGLKIDGVAVGDPSLPVAIGEKGVLLQKGKRHFIRAVRKA